MRIPSLLSLVTALLFVQMAGAVTPSLDKAIQFPVEKYQLANGLTVLLHPDRTIPAVSVHTWFRVGSKDEVPGRTGLAHFFEHMMFKGTAKFGKDTWGKFLNGKGADTNAFTSSDYTGYYINIPADHLGLALQIEADRMRNLSLSVEDVKSEREVVKEERRMRVDDSIEGGIYERIGSLMWTKLPYSWRPIGSMDDLNAASMEDLHAFYKQYYSPNNAVLVIAGAFDTAAVKTQIEKFYGGLPRETINRPTPATEPVQTVARTTTITREAQAPSLAVAFQLPPVDHADNYALDLLSIVLGSGNSSRLYRELVYKKEMAVGSSSYSSSHLLGGEFVVSASLKPKADPQLALSLIDKELAKLRNQAVSGRELEKARNTIMKDYVDMLKRVSGRARILANYEIVHGDYTRLFSDLKKYQAVTVEDLKRVARSYLTPEKKNVVIVLPRKSGGA